MGVSNPASPPSKMTVFSWLSLVVMGIASLMPSRFVPLLTGGLPIGFASPLLILVCAVAVLVVVVTGRTPDAPTIWRRIVRSWPIIAFTVIDIAFWLYAFLNRNDPDLASTMRLRYWAGFLLTFLALPAGYFLGLLNRGLGNRRLGVFLVVVTGISFFIGAAEYLHLMGYENSIAAQLFELNEFHRAELPIWTMLPNEPIRAKGLEIFPALYAIFALVTTAWALASKGPRWSRIVVLFFSFGILALSGSRTLLIAMLPMVVLWIVGRACHVGFRRWIKRDGAILAVLLVISSITVGVVVSAAPTGSQGVIGRMADSVKILEEGGDESIGIDDVLEVATNERTTIWKRALGIIGQEPLGTGFPFRFIYGKGHAHSEYLERLVWGGPLMFFGFLAFLFWLMFCVKTPEAPSFGLLVGCGIAVTTLAELVTMGLGLLVPIVFIVGVLIDEQWLNGKTPFVSRFQRKGGRSGG